MEERHVFDKFLRDDKLKTMWCPGCGNGIALQAVIRALDDTGIDPDKIVIVSGVGCSSRAVNYVSASGIHTMHGRPIAFATGLKMANPELTVLVITGDGDCTSIGGNHFIHACRRNIDLTVVVFNNQNYGMTGGQFSGTTPLGSITKTSVCGSYEPPFDVCALAQGAGASFVARSLTYEPVQLRKLIRKGIEHKGLSVIDAMCDCVSLYGRLNKLGNAAEMMKRWETLAVPASKAAAMPPEALRGKVLTGELFSDSSRREYTELYEEIRERAREA